MGFIHCKINLKVDRLTRGKRINYFKGGQCGINEFIKRYQSVSVRSYGLDKFHHFVSNTFIYFSTSNFLFLSIAIEENMLEVINYCGASPSRHFDPLFR